MRQLQNFLTILVFALLSIPAYSQAVNTQYTGWAAVFHKQKLTEKAGILFDSQYRLDRQFSKVSAYLIRPGVSFDLNQTYSAAAGYAFLGSYEQDSNERIFFGEHRVWEQLQLEQEFGRLSFTGRIRLEQRFIDKEDSGYSQRLRFYVRQQIPLVRQDEFSHGTYLAVQNELFLTVQHKDRAGGRVFDQNRAYFSIGHRFSKAIDAELGYQFRYQKETTNNSRDHIFQIALYTDFP